ncbi:MAG: DUF1109 domain-containing protein [Sphingomonadales bacterium]|nr:DUF1109 domain-containing protein [Sphingomonadales bacterium]
MPDSSDAFIDSLVADLKPVAPLRQGSGMALALAALLIGSVTVAAMLGLRRDLAAGHPAPLALTAAGVFLVLALASSWAAIDMARPAVGTRREGWGWTALMAAVLPGSALVLIASNYLAGQPIDLDRSGLGCFAVGSAVGLITATVLVVWLRRGAPSSPARAGLLTGVASGSAGIFAVSLWCPHDGLLHIGIWHGATIIAMGVLGRLILPRVLAW